MKKTIIGSVFMLSGILATMCVIISASMLFSTVRDWNNSRLLKVIYVNELGLPFTIGIILSFIGIIMLSLEYSNKDN